MPTVTITVKAVAPFTSANMSYSPDPLTVTGEEDIAFVFSPDSTPGLTWINFVPGDATQFSGLQINADKTLMTVTDLDTVDETINYSLVFADASGTRYNPDPQIINHPR